jgi:hypothetical protein
MKVTFGDTSADSDIILDYVLTLSVMNHAGDLCYFQDDIPLQQGFSMELEDNLLYANIDFLLMNIHERYGQKAEPKYNSIDMSENEYAEFLTDFSLTLNSIKKHYNDVILRNGVPFPYDVPEFYTSLKFYPGAAYFLFETELEYKSKPRHFEPEEMDEEINPYLNDEYGYYEDEYEDYNYYSGYGW